MFMIVIPSFKHVVMYELHYERNDASPFNFSNVSLFSHDNLQPFTCMLEIAVIISLQV